MNETTQDMLSNLKEFMRKDDVNSFIKTIKSNMPVWDKIKEDILEDAINYLTTAEMAVKVEEELLDPNPVFGKYIYICVELGADVLKIKHTNFLQKIYDTIHRYIVKYTPTYKGKTLYNLQTYELGFKNYVVFFMYITSLYTPYEYIHTFPIPDKNDKAKTKTFWKIYMLMRGKLTEFIELIDKNKKKIKHLTTPSVMSRTYNKLFKQKSSNRTKRIHNKKTAPNHIQSPSKIKRRAYFIVRGKDGKKRRQEVWEATRQAKIDAMVASARERANARRTSERARENEEKTARASARANSDRRVSAIHASMANLDEKISARERATASRATATRTNARANAPRTNARTTARATASRAPPPRTYTTALPAEELLRQQHKEYRKEINNLDAIIDTLEKLYTTESHSDIKMQYAKQILHSKVRKGKLEEKLRITQ